MTKADITNRLIKHLDCTREEGVSLVEEVLEIIKCQLVAGEEVKVSGFGKFEVRQKSERRGRNPQTGQPLTISERRVVGFKPSPMLKQRMSVSTRFGLADK